MRGRFLKLKVLVFESHDDLNLKLFLDKITHFVDPKLIKKLVEGWC